MGMRERKEREEGMGREGGKGFGIEQRR